MSAVYEEEAPVMIETSFSPRQLEMIQHRARILWVGCGTKTGKTIAFAGDAADTMLAGQRVAWCGPTAQRTRMGYDQIKEILEYAVRIGEARCNDSAMTIKTRSGGSFEHYTGENPQAIFGDGVDLFIIDEASRQTVSTFHAAITLTSATRGRIRSAFNLEHGSKNWAIENLLRVQAKTPAEREASNEDYMLFPTLEGGFVRQEEIEEARQNMPLALFEALYLARIPSSDVTLFHNLDEIFSGPAYGQPRPRGSYIAGIDLARKSDYTVCSILDVTEPTHVRLAAAVRFNTIDWTLQFKKLAEFTKEWNVSKSWFDATGIGDVVEAGLRDQGMNIEPYIFTERSRKDLIEGLVVACDGKAIQASSEEQFKNHKHELRQFGYEFKEKKIRYAAPEHEHDDCVMSLALAWYGKQHGVFGMPMIERVTPRTLRSSMGVW